MRLLLDENISESVAARIRNAFPDTEHVRRVVGTGATDRAIEVLSGPTPPLGT